MIDNVFAMVPVEVLADKRLTLEQMRVLIGLLSFRNKNTDVVWPGREQLAERCGGMHPNNISKATSGLVKLGWLEKDGNGGRSQSSSYRITVPDVDNLSTKSETLADSATSETLAQSASQPPETLAQSASKTLAQSARGKEQTIEQTNKGNRQGARGLLAARGLPAKLADSWLKVRQAKRLAVTEEALEAIQREATKADLTFEQVITICCEKGWAGFNAKWDRGDGGVSAQTSAPQKSQKPSTGNPWWSSDDGVLNRGRELGVEPRPGESMSSFKNRLFTAENNAKTLVSS